MVFFAICVVLKILKGKHLRHYVNYYKNNFKPKRLEVAESYRFHRCCQEEISEFPCL